MTAANLSPDFWRRIEQALAQLKPARLTVAAVRKGPAPDGSRQWIPPQLLPLCESAAFAELPTAQQRRYNQLYALQATEQFIWLERELVIRPAQRLLGDATLPPQIRELLEAFVADELHHNDALFELLRLAAPEIYEHQPFAFFDPPWSVRLAVAAATLLPRRLPAWILFIGVAEEHTILISRAYGRDPDCDPAFSAAFRAHAIDEARHCRMDDLLADWLTAALRPVQQQLSDRLLGQLFRRYYDVRWGTDRPVLHLAREFGLSPALRQRLLDDAQLGRGPEFRSHLFDQHNAPISFRKAQRHRGLAAAINSVCAPPA